MDESDKSEESDRREEFDGEDVKTEDENNHLHDSVIHTVYYCDNKVKNSTPKN